MKRLLKIFLWLAGIFVVLLILLIAGFRLFFPADKARVMAVEKGSELLGRRIEIGNIDLSLWGGLGLVLEDVKISNPDRVGEGEFLVADNIDLKLKLLPLMTGQYRIDRLIINSPVISMIRTSSGEINYAFVKAEKLVDSSLAEQLTPEAKTAGLAVSFDQFEIEDGRLSYVDDSSGLSFVLSGLDLTTVLSNPRENFFISTGELSIASIQIKSGTAIPDLSFALKYEAAYDFIDQQLSVSQAELDINGLLFSIEGSLQHKPDSMTGKANIKSARQRVSDLLKLLPESQADLLKDYALDGHLSMDIDIGYQPNEALPFDYSGTITLGDFSLAHADIPGQLKFQTATVDFKPDNLRLNIEQGTFDSRPLKGYLIITEFDHPVVKGELAGSIDLAFIMPFLPEGNSQEIAGLAQFDIKFSGLADQPKQFEFFGELSVTDGRYNSMLIPQPLESFNMEAYFDRDLANIRSMTARTRDGNLEFAGRITGLVPMLLADSSAVDAIYPVIDGNLKGQLDLGFLVDYLPPRGNPKLSGQLDLDLTLLGSTEFLDRIISHGTISINNGAYSDDFLSEPLKSLDIQMTLLPDTISISSMHARFVTSDLSFKGKLIKPFPYLLPTKNIDRANVAKPLFLFELTSDRFDVDRLFPEAAPGSGTDGTSRPTDSVSVIILPDIDGRGTFSIDTMIYSMVEFTKVTGKIKVAERRIECYDVLANAYTGRVSGKTTIDLNDFNNPHYTGEFKASDIEADDFVSRFTKFGGFLFGKIDLEGGYDAYGWEPETFLNSLRMNSTVDMKSGKLVTSGEAFSAISALAGKAGQTFDKEQTIKNMATKISVKDGRVRLDTLTTRLGKLGDVTLNGAYSFSGQLDYGGSVLLSREVTQKMFAKGGLLGGLAGLLSDKSVERVRLPIKIGGTVDKPSFSIDYSSLSKKAGDQLKDEAESLLKGLFKKK